MLLRFNLAGAGGELLRAAERLEFSSAVADGRRWGSSTCCRSSSLITLIGIGWTPVQILAGKYRAKRDGGGGLSDLDEPLFRSVAAPVTRQAFGEVARRLSRINATVLPRRGESWGSSRAAGPLFCLLAGVWYTVLPRVMTGPREVDRIDGGRGYRGDRESCGWRQAVPLVGGVLIAGYPRFARA